MTGYIVDTRALAYLSKCEQEVNTLLLKEFLDLQRSGSLSVQALEQHITFRSLLNSGIITKPKTNA